MSGSGTSKKNAE